MSQSPRGFTLVEMLVALAVFALLAAAGVGVLAQAATTREAVADRLDAIARLQRARAVIEADLSQAAARRVRHADGLPARQAFWGQGTPGPGPVLALARRGWANPDGAPRASLQYVEYHWRDGQLQRLARHALDGAAAGTPQVLLDGVHGVRVHYRHRGQWLDGWPGGADQVPEAVRLDLDLDRMGTVELRVLMPGQWP